MKCEVIQVALSAKADDEKSPVPDSVVEWHVRGCAHCQAFAAALSGRRHHPARALAANEVADRVVAAAARIDRAGTWKVLRLLLFAVAFGELAFAVVGVLSHSSTQNLHVERHLGAFQFAFAVGLFTVAVRPARARAFVPFTAALAAAMLVASVVDTASGVAPLVTEGRHALEVAGLLLVWALASRWWWPGRRPHVVDAGPSLTAVPDQRDLESPPHSPVSPPADRRAG